MYQFYLHSFWTTKYALSGRNMVRWSLLLLTLLKVCLYLPTAGTWSSNFLPLAIPSLLLLFLTYWVSKFWLRGLGQTRHVLIVRQWDMIPVHVLGSLHQPNTPTPNPPRNHLPFLLLHSQLYRLSLSLRMLHHGAHHPLRKP